MTDPVCPKCKGKLWHLSHKGMVVERCSSCDGMWFDAGELSLALEVSRKVSTEGGTSRGIPCLKCRDETLLEVPFPGTTVVVDCCPRCKGIWLDRGELSKLKKAVSGIVAAATAAPVSAAAAQQAVQAMEAAERAAALRSERCPKCDGKLWHLSRKGMVIERCQACDGKWYDAGELTRTLGISHKISLADAQPAGVACLKCSGKLLVTVNYPRTDVPIDVCPDCRGIWLDKGELERLQQAFGTGG